MSKNAAKNASIHAPAKLESPTDTNSKLKSQGFSRLAYPRLAYLGSLLVLLSACAPSSPPPGAGAPPGMPVKVGNAQTSKVLDSSDYVATLNSRQSVTLQPRIAGQVSQVLVKQGDTINAGTAILQIDPAEQQAALTGKAAAVESALAEVAASRATLVAKASAVDSARAILGSKNATRLAKTSDLALQRRDLKRDTELQADGAITQRELERRVNTLETATANLSTLDQEIKAQKEAIAEAAAELAKAKADIVVSQKRLQESQANTQQQQVQLQFYRIAAPFSGTVGDIPVKVGDFVNTSSKLVTLTQNDRLEVEIAVPLDKLEKLKPGLAVQLLDAQDKPKATATVSFIAPNVNAQSQSILVKAMLENDKNALRADQLVKARIVWEERVGILIPKAAISRVGGQDFVFVVEKAPTPKDQPQAQGTQVPAPKPGQPPALIVRQKPIKIGKIVDNNQEVLAGLQTNQQIVVSGIQLLRDQMPVIPVPDKPVSQAGTKS
jgi:multidrug efflux pump subunit AcrA (membrane-fusion protein)